MKRHPSNSIPPERQREIDRLAAHVTTQGRERSRENTKLKDRKINDVTYTHPLDQQ